VMLSSALEIGLMPQTQPELVWSVTNGPLVERRDGLADFRGSQTGPFGSAQGPALGLPAHRPLVGTARVVLNVMNLGVIFPRFKVGW
jgi:hypothetical protein